MYKVSSNDLSDDFTTEKIVKKKSVKTPQHEAYFFRRNLSSNAITVVPKINLANLTHL